VKLLEAATTSRRGDRSSSTVTDFVRFRVLPSSTEKRKDGLTEI